MQPESPELLLCQLLGELHALWLPLRDPGSPCWAAIWSLRWQYPRRGLPWRGGGSKEQSAMLSQLTRSGLARRSRSDRERTVGAILTSRGIRAAAALCGFGACDAEVFASELLRRRPAGSWVPEIALSDGRGWGDKRSDELTTIEHAGLQALSLSYVVSNATLYGHVYYKLTQAGEAGLRKWDGCVGELPEPIAGALEAYSEGFSTCLGRLQSMPRLDREIGEIPLPVSRGATEAER